jgi:hypothetical protein
MSAFDCFFSASLIGLFLALFHRMNKEQPPAFEPYEKTLAFKFNPRLENGERVYVGVAIHVTVTKLVIEKAVSEALFPFAEEQAYLWALSLKSPPDAFRHVQYSVLREMVRTLSFSFLRVEKVAVIIGPVRKKETTPSAIEQHFAIAQKILQMRAATSDPELKQALTDAFEDARISILDPEREEELA